MIATWSLEAQRDEASEASTLALLTDDMAML